MDQCLLTRDEIIAAYKLLLPVYPYIPSAILWRAWEYAAYQHYHLSEPVLDVGCGDGRFFQLLWPELSDVVGIDLEPEVVAAAERSGVYREVQIAAAQALPFDDNYFASVFANCSLEHMADLTSVLRGISRCLRPGGTFLFSVVTDKFIEWLALPMLVDQAGASKLALTLQDDYVTYHHLENALSPDKWTAQLARFNLHVEHYVPLLPELSGRLFLFIDHLWHLKREEGEWGDLLPGLFATWPAFETGLEEILGGILRMEPNWKTGCGMVFQARKQV